MNKKVIALVTASAFLVLSGTSFAFVKNGNAIEPDNIEYDEDVVANLEAPHILGASADEIPDVKKVELHYHNDDGKCGKDTTTPGSAGGRAFYIWNAKTDGVELFPDEVANNGQDMSVTIDLTSDKFSKYAGTTSLLFIIKYRKVNETDLNWGGQSSDTEISFTEFAPDAQGNVVVWSTNGPGSDVMLFHTEAETKVDGVKYAEFIDWKTIKCTNTAASVTYNLYAFDETYYKIDAKERDTYKKWYLVKTGEGSGASFNIVLPHTAHINMVYTIESLDSASTTGLKKTTSVVYDNLYNDARFNQLYTYAGNDLGVTYTKEQTTFKVWAPTAGNMTLRLYSMGATVDFGGSNRFAGYHMNYIGNGVWSLTVKGDLDGRYYTYFVDNSSGSQEAMDPYAKACGLNGLRGFVYNPARTNPEGWDELPVVWNNVSGLDIKTPQDLSIYEVHIQDFTKHETWNGQEKPGTYNAFVESGTSYTDGTKTVTTGYDHLNELGVKAVQLLPVFDHDNDETNLESYNWGYNPLNYNCIEGVYSSDPKDGAVRIKEFKNMILKLSQTDAHTRVIMDVVYNHVSRASGFCYTKLMPKYFFRVSSSGEYTNGSGCSNEVKTEHKMVRKFIVDSVKFWATEYKIKGFRFDLMGLIDTGTMRAVKDELYKIDPDIYVYGEGWDAGGYGEMYKVDGNDWEWRTVDASVLDENGKATHGTKSSDVYSELYPSSTSPGLIGCFNDQGRNDARGDNNPGWGYISQGTGDVGDKAYKVAHMMAGVRDCGWNPYQTINYVSCHDNYALYDQLMWTLSNDGGTTPPSPQTVAIASAATHAAVLSSNGVAFMQGGEELFRTKVITGDEIEANLSKMKMYGDWITHNAYKSPFSTNAFDWSRKISITYKGSTYDVSGQSAMFAKAIKARNNLARYSYDDLKDGKLYAEGSKINFWSCIDKDNGNVAVSGVSLIPFQIDNYFFFYAGRSGGEAPFGDYNKCTVVYSTSSDYHQTTSGIYVGPYNFVCMKRGA